MLTEQAALAALPPSGFLRDYVLYSAQYTDSPIAFHIQAGLGLLTQSAPIDMACSFGAVMHANLFTLSVGPSGEARKSTAVTMARRAMRKAAPKAVAEMPGSTEGLAETVRESPRVLIAMEEFGAFLAQSERGYLHSLRTAYTSLWDCSPVGRALAKSRRGAIEEPRVSIMAACAVPYLEMHTTPVDWEGGFMSRFLTFYAARERNYLIPNPDPQAGAPVVSALEALGAITRPVPGSWAGYTPEGRDALEAWSLRLQGIAAAGLPRASMGGVSRAPAMAMRVAMLLAWDYGTAREPGAPWTLGVEELVPAMRIVDLHVQSVIEIGAGICTTRDQRDVRAVQIAVNREMVSLGEISAQTGLLTRRTKEILETLMARRAVHQTVGLTGESTFSPGPGPEADTSPRYALAPPRNDLQ